MGLHGKKSGLIQCINAGCVRTVAECGELEGGVRRRGVEPRGVGRKRVGRRRVGRRRVTTKVDTRPTAVYGCNRRQFWGGNAVTDACYYRNLLGFSVEHVGRTPWPVLVLFLWPTRCLLRLATARGAAGWRLHLTADNRKFTCLPKQVTHIRRTVYITPVGFPWVDIFTAVGVVLIVSVP